MRHFIAYPLAIAALPVGMLVATGEAGLVALSGSPLRLGPGQLGTALCTVDIAAITVTTDHDLTMTAGAIVESSTALHRKSPSGKNCAGREPETA
jgi:hypothetical protein